MIDRFFARRPWLWIVLFFVFFILLWVWFIRLAMDNSPPVVPLPPAGSIAPK